MNKVIACNHVCSSDCRREGCNCECGEFHQETIAIKVQHLPSDYNDAPTVDELIKHLGQQTGVNLEDEENEGNRTAADYADAEPVETE